MSDEDNCPATKSLQGAKRSITKPGGDAKSPNYEAKRLAAEYFKSKPINKIHAGQKNKKIITNPGGSLQVAKKSIKNPGGSLMDYLIY